MTSCVIFGGSGYIGRNLAARLSRQNRFDRIVLADMRPFSGALPAKAEFVTCDVKQPMSADLEKIKAEWIFNFSAVHREPGHAANEYFDTNLAGARNVCAYAEKIGCKNILFTSSIAVYGPTNGPTSETSPTYPTTPYGISKLCAELIHEGWQRADSSCRLRVCRPGVIYGPGDPGNILRMIRAVKKGYFVFPGSRDLRKSYGYIEGLLDSFEWAMAQSSERLTFNYVERETEPLGNLVDLTQVHLSKKIPTFNAPIKLLVPLAHGVQLLSGGKSPIHPVRVRKAATSTHIVPQVLLNAGFNFRYDFAASLKHWASQTPEDFQ